MTVHYPYMQLVCAKCHKPISTILEPCPSCGYQHPLTEYGKKVQDEYLATKKNEAKP